MTARSTFSPYRRRWNCMTSTKPKVIACDARIEAALKDIEAACPPPATPLPAPRHRTQQPNAFTFPAREALHRIVGVDLTQIHGLGSYLALKLVGECGTDVSAWPSAK